MAVRASELSAIIEHPPDGSSEIARVVTALRALRDQGMAEADRASFPELALRVGAWAEKAQIGADAAAVLAELGDLVAVRLGDGTMAASQYVRSLELAPTDFSVSERATLHLRRLGALGPLAHVLKEHARVLESMPWIDADVRAQAWTRLAQLRPEGSAGSRASRRDDTPTTPHARRGAVVAPPEPQPLTTSVSRSVAPPRSRTPLRALLASALALSIALWFMDERAPVEDVASDWTSGPVARAPDVPESRPVALPPPRLQPAPGAAAPLPPKAVHATLARASIRVHEALLGRRDVVRAVGPALAAVEACSSAPPEGEDVTLDVTWLVRASGRIERVMLREPAQLHERARNCVLEALRDVRFPRGERDVMRVRGTIALSVR